MTFEENFGKVKIKFDNIDSANINKLDENIAMEVVITDEDCGGIFYVANIDGVFSVEPYDYHDNTVRVTLSAGDFIKLTDRRCGLDTLIKNGKIVIEGNENHARKLFELKDKPQRKPRVAKKADAEPPAKKETVKKEAVKKEATKKEATKKKTTKK